MKLSKICVVLITTIVILCGGTYAMAVQNQPDTVISQEALMNMSSNERNAIFEALKQQKKLEADAARAINTETVQALANMDVETFKGKAMAVADTLVVFFDKLGVKANEFIQTDVGLLTAIGIVYKMGVFGSVWDSIVCSIGALVFLVILYKLNTKKVITRKTYNSKGEITGMEDTIVPAFSAVSGNDAGERTAYSVVGSIVCAIVIIVLLVYM